MQRGARRRTFGSAPARRNASAAVPAVRELANIQSQPPDASQRQCTRSLPCVGRLVQSTVTGPHGKSDVENLTRHSVPGSRSMQPCPCHTALGYVDHAKLYAPRNVALTLPEIRADALRVEQMLVNLLSNAAEYSTPDTEIVVEAVERPDAIEIAVTNRGSGLSAEDAAKVFSRFYRSKQHVGRVEGLGLGLYIAKGIADAHGVACGSSPSPAATPRFGSRCRARTRRRSAGRSAAWQESRTSRRCRARSAARPASGSRLSPPSASCPNSWTTVLASTRARRRGKPATLGLR